MGNVGVEGVVTVKGVGNVRVEDVEVKELGVGIAGSVTTNVSSCIGLDMLGMGVTICVSAKVNLGDGVGTV